MTRPHRFLRVTVTTAEPWEYDGFEVDGYDDPLTNEYMTPLTFLTRTLFTNALPDDLHERFDPHAESVTIEPCSGPRRRRDDS